MDTDVLAFQYCVIGFLMSRTHILSCRPRARRWWVRPINENRAAQSDYFNLLQEMRLGDQEQFFVYTRMTVQTFDYLLSLVGRLLRKNSIRSSLPPGMRLAIALRYLATGDDLQTIAWNFRIGKSTCCVVLRETIRVIGHVLSNLYLKEPSREDYQCTADRFLDRWNLPNCIGAIDGKHVAIQAPNNSGSEYFCYKSHFSIVLLAICDADYIFTHVDIGAYGSQSDGGIFGQSAFGKKMNNNSLPIPIPEPLPYTINEFPFFFVGDGAFALHLNMMRPYPGMGLSQVKKVFNYRLSRARRIIENAFGILVARWRIFHRVINASPENVDSIIMAAVCLHNFLKNLENNRAADNKVYCPPSFIDRERNGETVDGDWRNEVPQNAGAIQPLITLQRRLGARNATNNATANRDILAEYLSTIGSVPWQTQRVNRGVQPGLLD